MSREAGAAMLEFILVLPFLWLIVMLTINFGHALLERHRALVAARELGLRYGEQRADGTDSIAGVIAELERDTLAPRGLSGLMGGPDREGCVGAGAPEARGRVGRAMDTAGTSPVGQALGSFLARLSMTEAYHVRLEGPQIGGLLRNAGHSACFAIDGLTWTHGETGGAAGLLRSTLSGIGGALLRLIGVS